jgi:hypothetical protein
MSSRSKKEKRGKKSLRENFIDQTMKEDNSTFSLFNWNNDEENYESYDNETVENFPQATPMNVIYTDTNGNLSNTSDLGLQNLTVNSDTKIVGNTTVNGVLTSTNAGVEINGADLGGPNANTRINSQGIIFGGANNGRESSSAQITAGKHRADTLCIVGMSNSAMQSRKIEMWAEGGTTHNGSIQLNGDISATESVNGKSVNATESIKIGSWVISEGSDGHLIFSKNGAAMGTNNQGHVRIAQDGNIWSSRSSGAGWIADNIGGIKSDVTGIKSDVTGIKSDVTVIKSDVTGIKSDVSNIKDKYVKYDDNLYVYTAGGTNAGGALGVCGFCAGGVGAVFGRNDGTGDAKVPVNFRKT